MKVTITDIAKLAGVSKSTVSAVLNDNPLIKDETKIRVREAMKKLDYRPNELARALARKQTKTIGLIIKEIDNPYFARITSGVYDSANKEGYSVLLGSSELKPLQEQETLNVLLSKKVDGLIISSLRDNGDFTHLLDLRRRNVPFVLLDNFEMFQANIVDVNNVESGMKAVQYLIQKGHRKIAYLAGPDYSVHSYQRLEGYKLAHLSHNIPLDDALIFQAGSYLENGMEVGEHIARMSPQTRPTALYCFNDLVAIGSIYALRQAGLRIPDDMAVVGNDDTPLAQATFPPLTTVHIPIYEIGRQATELLFAQVRQKENPLNKKIILEAHLVERKSA
ncbi:MAG: LacI family transcriptional regulator [Calditrichaeota bacterium]|nr:LacI family transcriptional regulator [Calditrichota bacterium]